ncbi:MAG: Fic family protein [Desulfonatronovibrio sp.]
MRQYNWQKSDWPYFTYSLSGLEDKLFEFAEKIGRISGILDSLPEDIQQETLINMMLEEAIKTSEIEGEYISRQDVLSSIRKNLGLHVSASMIKDPKAEGLGQLMIDVRNSFKEPLSIQKLFHWHRMLFGASDNIMVGNWRTHDEPMQVISGAIGKEKVHFEAPPSSQIPSEMDRFIHWFNETKPTGKKPLPNTLVRSAIAHLYFETIHPFEDGNGRIGRAIAEKSLSQGINRPVLLSLSDTIEANKRDYYDALKVGQRSNEVTKWIHYFIDTVLQAQDKAEKQIEFTLQKVKFFDKYELQLSERQKKVINRMLDEGPDGFEGGMNARKYIGITKVSKATATRDIQQLVDLGVLVRYGKAGGRSTSYRVNL